MYKELKLSTKGTESKIICSVCKNPVHKFIKHSVEVFDGGFRKVYVLSDCCKEFYVIPVGVQRVGLSDNVKKHRRDIIVSMGVAYLKATGYDAVDSVSILREPLFRRLFYFYLVDIRAGLSSEAISVLNSIIKELEETL